MRGDARLIANNVDESLFIRGDNAADTIIACGVTTRVFGVFLLSDKWQVPEYLTLCDHP
jgi:hypothetical protein|tara:strand:- start:2246 stop:2422 length:177 start_codon:yes stop_codon:yes gene_type:complete